MICWAHYSSILNEVTRSYLEKLHRNFIMLIKNKVDNSIMCHRSIILAHTADVNQITKHGHLCSLRTNLIWNRMAHSRKISFEMRKLNTWFRHEMCSFAMKTCILKFVLSVRYVIRPKHVYQHEGYEIKFVFSFWINTFVENLRNFYILSKRCYSVSN